MHWRSGFLKATAIGLLAAGFAAPAMAASTTADINATVAAPITISKVADLRFGTFAAHHENSGTVVVAANGARTFSNGVSSISTGSGDTVSAASFTVNGAAGATFAITLPTSVTLQLTGDTSKTMSVDTFTSNPSGSGTLTGGTATVTVGATLRVGANQATGLYSAANGLAVTVTYN